MSDEANSPGGDERATEAEANEADRKRRQKLEELVRRRAEHAAQQADAPAPAPAPAVPAQDDRRAKLREFLDRNREGDAGAAAGGRRGELLRRALQNRRDGGRSDGGNPDGAGGLLRRLRAGAGDEQGGGGKEGDRPLLRRLRERAGNEGQRGGSGSGMGDGRLLQRLRDMAGEAGRGGASEREAELEEQIRRLEAELKNLRDNEAGEASSSERPADERPRRLRSAVRRND